MRRYAGDESGGQGHEKRKRAHILVVDDEKSLCELLEITFRKDGHRVEVANGVEAARRKLEGSLYDIVISDIRMPGGSGLDLLRFTKEIAPDSFFLLMTALPDLDTAVDALNSGADRLLSKTTIMWSNCAGRSERFRRA